MVVKFTSIGSQVTKQESKEEIKHQKSYRVKSNALICHNTTCPCFFELEYMRKEMTNHSCFSPPFSPQKEHLKQKYWNKAILNVQISQILCIFLIPM